MAPRLLVGRQYVHHVAAVGLAPDVQQAIDVLDLAERLDDVGERVRPDVVDARLKVVELRWSMVFTPWSSSTAIA